MHYGLLPKFRQRFKGVRGPSSTQPLEHAERTPLVVPKVEVLLPRRHKGRYSSTRGGGYGAQGGRHEEEGGG